MGGGGGGGAPEIFNARRVVSRLEMVAFKRYGLPKKCPQI